MAELTLRELSKDNIKKVLALRVSAAQQGFVPTVAHMIARGSYEEKAWFRAIYADEEPVGFVKVWEENQVEPDLWGFMIDVDHQGKGYAKEALYQTIEVIKTRNPLARRLCVGFLAEDGNAQGFYEKFGFKIERKVKFDGWEESLAYLDLASI